MSKNDGRFWIVLVVITSVMAIVLIERSYGQSGGYLGGEENDNPYQALEDSYEYLQNKYGKEGAKRWLEQANKGQTPTVLPLNRPCDAHESKPPAPKKDWPMDGHPPGYTYPDDELGKKSDGIQDPLGEYGPVVEMFNEGEVKRLDDRLDKIEERIAELERQLGVCTDDNELRIGSIIKRIETLEAAAELKPDQTKVRGIYELRNGRILQVPASDEVLKKWKKDMPGLEIWERPPTPAEVRPPNILRVIPKQQTIKPVTPLRGDTLRHFRYHPW